MRGRGERWNVEGRGGELVELALEQPRRRLVETTRETQIQGFARVMPAVKFLDVVERDRLQSLGGPAVRVAVRVILVELDLERPLAQLFIVVAAQRFGDVVERLVAKPLEIFGREPRLGDHLGHERNVSLQVVAMDGAREDGHFFVAGPVDRGGHRVKRLEELVVGERFRAPFGDHRGRQGRQALLARRVALRAGAEHDPERDQRIGWRVQERRPIGSGRCLGLIGPCSMHGKMKVTAAASRIGTAQRALDWLVVIS